MTPDELRKALDADGWKFGSGHYRQVSVPWYAWKRFPGPVDCVTNEKPPSIILYPSAIEMHGKVHRSVEFELCGYVGDRWLNLKAYSVQMDEAMDAIPRCVALLTAAWNAAAALKK